MSYNSADYGVVEDFARKLRDAGLAPFLDRWYLAPGARWCPKLEQTLSACKAVAIFMGPGEFQEFDRLEDAQAFCEKNELDVKRAPDGDAGPPAAP